MKRARFATFTAQPWRHQIGILHGPVKPCKAWVATTFGKDVAAMIEEGNAGMTYRDRDCPVLIWLKDINSIPTLVHELLHAVFFILEDKGLSLSEDSEEAYTYTTGDLLTQILERKKWKVV